LRKIDTEPQKSVGRKRKTMDITRGRIHEN